MSKCDWKKDTRKSKGKWKLYDNGECSISKCRDSSGVIFHGWPLCDRHWNYYAEIDIDFTKLKTILKIKQKSKPPPAEEEDWDPFEEEDFDPFEE